MARKELTCASFVLMPDGRAVPLRDLTEEERERWRESLHARLSETMSDYYARRPEEYAALGI